MDLVVKPVILIVCSEANGKLPLLDFSVVVLAVRSMLFVAAFTSTTLFLYRQTSSLLSGDLLAFTRSAHFRADPKNALSVSEDHAQAGCGTCRWISCRTLPVHAGSATRHGHAPARTWCKIPANHTWSNNACCRETEGGAGRAHCVHSD